MIVLNKTHIMLKKSCRSKLFDKTNDCNVNTKKKQR